MSFMGIKTLNYTYTPMAEKPNYSSTTDEQWQKYVSKFGPLIQDMTPEELNTRFPSRKTAEVEGGDKKQSIDEAKKPTVVSSDVDDKSSRPGCAKTEGSFFMTDSERADG